MLHVLAMQHNNLNSLRDKKLPKQSSALSFSVISGQTEGKLCTTKGFDGSITIAITLQTTGIHS